jgi:glycosyltransferase domain-containing protein
MTSVHRGALSSYTMVIPTHDRPAMLARLLGYLEREQSHFPIIVLDSSHDADRARNAARIAQSPLAVRIAASDASAHPYRSIRAGLKLVTTPYCSICADDDVILLPALHECLSVLEADQTVSAAHGLYFTFSEAKFFDLLSIANRGPSVDVDDPLLRVRQLFAHYEPLLHAVHRTAVLQDVFARIGEVQTTLGVELLTASLTVASGKTLRIEHFYHGRGTTPSLADPQRYPWDILAASPAALFRDYGEVRRILGDTLSRSSGTHSPGTVMVLLDLVFLRYLRPFLAPRILDLLITERLQGSSATESAEHAWRTAVPAHRPFRLRERLARQGWTRFIPEHIAGKRLVRDYVHSTTTSRGTRTYRIVHEFLFPERTPPPVVGRDAVVAMLERLDAY